MKLLIVATFCLSSFVGLSQTTTAGQYSSSGCAGLTLVSMGNNCSQAAELARRDVRANALFLVLASGESPVVFTTDSAFEEQFGVQYFEEGCIAPAKECLVVYNCTIFDYLQATYGGAWRRRVRKDVVGLKEWRRKR